MEFWRFLWQAVFVAALVVFAGMSVWVAIGGYQDLKQLFETLKENRDEKPGGGS